MNSGNIEITPGYLLQNGEPLTEAKLRQVAVPTARMAVGSVTEREMDMAALQAAMGSNVRPNVLTNGNFTEERWDADSGAAPAGVDTVLAQGWFTHPTGAGVMLSQGLTSPDRDAAMCAVLSGALGVTTVEFGQNLLRSTSALLWRKLTFSAWIYNNTGANFAPHLVLSTADAPNDFTSVSEQESVDLVTCPNQQWTQVSAIFDPVNYANLEAGMRVALKFAAGTLNAGGKTISIAKAKLEVGEAITPMPLDPNTDLQNGSVTTSKIAAAAVTTTKVADLAITEAKLADSAVTTAKVAALAVTNAKIADGTIEKEKLNAALATQLAKGTAKAWVNFDGSTGTIRSSFNVSSVTKNGTGDFTINFTAALADANYSITGWADDPFTAERAQSGLVSGYAAHPPTPTAVRIGVTRSESGGVLAASHVCLTIFGN